MAQTDWSSLGTPVPGSPASPRVAQNADGRLEVFLDTQGVDIQGDALWHIWQTSPGGDWNTWASLNWPANLYVASFAVGMNADGRLEIFISGSDGALWHTWQTTAGGSWNNTWFSLSHLAAGVDLSGVFAVVRDTDGRLEVFTRGSDGAFWHIWQTAPNGTWSAWASLGMPTIPLGYPIPGRNADGRIELFTLGSDGALWHIWQTKAGGSTHWNNTWFSLGRPPATVGPTLSPAVSQNADGRLEVFISDSVGAIWHISQTTPNGTWSTWSSLSGPTNTKLMGIPTVGRNTDGRLEVLVLSTDGALWHIVQTAPGGGWNTWDSLGAPPNTSLLSSLLFVSENADGRLEVFAVASGTLWHASQVTPGGPWG